MVNDLTEAAFGRDFLQKQMTGADFLSWCFEKNFLHLGNIGEASVANRAKVKLMSPCTPGVDTVNGIQIKTAQTHPRTLNKDPKTLKAWVGVEGSSGPIAAQVIEAVTNQTYYFWIPEYAYFNINAQSISIPFEPNGIPRKIPKRALKNYNWWDFEMSRTKFFKQCRDYDGS